MDANLRVQEARRQVERQAKPWVEQLARLGFAAKGIVFITVGVLAGQMALGRGGGITDAEGALQTIAARSYGTFMLGLVALGLAGYAVWRVVEAWVDPEREGSEPKGLAKRVGHALVGVVYAGLALSAIGILRGDGGGGANVDEQSLTGWLLAQPMGRWLVGLVGAGVIFYFLGQVLRAFRGEFPEQLRAGDLSGERGRWAKRLGTFGLIGYGVVFGLLGFFLIRAALVYDPGQAGGLDRSLETLARQPYGQALLGIAAAGLVAYGCYMLLIAWFRRDFFA
jgi:hypothetical protein